MNSDNATTTTGGTSSGHPCVHVPAAAAAAVEGARRARAYVGKERREWELSRSSSSSTRDEVDTHTDGDRTHRQDVRHRPVDRDCQGVQVPAGERSEGQCSRGFGATFRLCADPGLMERERDDLSIFSCPRR